MARFVAFPAVRNILARGSTRGTVVLGSGEDAGALTASLRR